MILYDSIGPNPRVVTMFVAEKGLTIEKRMLDIVKGENRSGSYLDVRRAGTTPALVLDDGSTLCETIAICEYLDEVHPEPALIGTTPKERAETRMWVRRIDLTVTEPMTTGFRAAEGRPMFEPRMRVIRADAADDLKALAKDGLTAIEAEMGDQWIVGDRFTLADIALFAFIEFGAMVGQPMPGDLPKLAAWRERVAARPSATAG
ncbi:glutathione S-transferase family protein [Sphingomonas radiodurans]|uniref:glutathione S-transferase family protein n=1 Tax=Sphingomonas radiodurans TaxID=2890321 RepID=UPI001E2D4EDE|nr:glutathione S-transferase family protein [Sphingomonas radiodurans]WBH17772.1 glutathione S-transferase family protein [Sphingomonas radiodurans]